MDSFISKKYPFNKWTWRTAGWATICFLLISGITGIFSFLFDVLLFQIKLGYYYSYFAIIFYTITLYFFYERFGSNWFGLFSFGLCGLVGIPIEYVLEWQIYHTLKSPWFAIAWGGIYILYGLVVDMFYWILKLQENSTIAVVISSAIFSLLFILISYIPLRLFYVSSDPNENVIDFLQFWYFMIPFSVIEGIIGAYAGMHFGRSLKRRKMEFEINQEEEKKEGSNHG